MKEHRMQALCKYCRTMTTPAPAHSGRARLCRNCLRPYEPAATLRTGGVAPGSLSPLPRWAPERGTRTGAEPGTPPGTPTGGDPICPYLRDWHNEQTVHLTPQKHNACYARMRQHDHWWSPSPWVVSRPTPVTLHYQAGCCFTTYMSCPAFRPLGTLEVAVEEGTVGALQPGEPEA